MVLPPRLIPLSAPDLHEDDLRLVTEVLRSRYLASGPVAERFEEAVASRLGARFAVAVSSGTAALHLAVIAAGVTDGDLVVTSPFSFVASANAILYERGVPVFVDIDPATCAVDPQRTVEAIDTLAHRKAGWRHLLPRTCGSAMTLRAVLPVHLFGLPATVAPIVAAARAAGIAVIEDACQALGAAVDGRTVGTWGDAGVFGFYPNKQITSGEGGMLVTDNAEWARLFRSLRNQGRSPDGDWFHYERLGFNYRLDEMSAALGLAQFARLDSLLARRAAVAARYDAAFSRADGVAPLGRPPAHVTRSWSLYVVRLDEDVDRARVMNGLRARGVMSRPYFQPIHLQSFYRERFGWTEGDFPETEDAGRRLLALPMAPALPDDDIDYVTEAVIEQVRAARRTAGRPDRRAVP